MTGRIAEQLTDLVATVQQNGFALYDLYLGAGLKEQQVEIAETASRLAGRECRARINPSLPADCALIHLRHETGESRTTPLYWGRNLTPVQQEIYRRLRLDHTDRDRAEKIARTL